MLNVGGWVCTSKLPIVLRAQEIVYYSYMDMSESHRERDSDNLTSNDILSNAQPSANKKNVYINALFTCKLNRLLKRKNAYINEGQSLTTNWFVASSLQPTTCHLIRLSTCTLSHMTYSISYVTSLNNTCGQFYKLSHSGLQQMGYKQVCNQTLSINESL